MIVVTGATVRLTGSGLGCPGWPQCSSETTAPDSLHSWIEFGNRLFATVVLAASVLAVLCARWRVPFRQDIYRVSLLLPLGVLAQGGLGAVTVIFELKPAIVMLHFLLSMAILTAAARLLWLSYYADSRPRLDVDSRSRLLIRLWTVFAAIILFAGTAASAAGPHAGSAGTGEVVPRLTFKGVHTLKWVIEQHGRLGTALLLSTVLLALYLFRKETDSRVLKILAFILPLLVLQGIVGIIQYKSALPATLVWVHVVFATTIWTLVSWILVGTLKQRSLKTEA